MEKTMTNHYEYTFTKKDYLNIVGMPLLSLATKNQDESAAFNHLDQVFQNIKKYCQSKNHSNNTDFFECAVKNHLIGSGISDACIVMTPFLRVHWSAEYGLHATNSLTLHSSHFLPYVPEGHKCGRFHGHNFHIICNWLKSQCNNAAQVCTPTYEKLNKKFLNEIEGLENPTSENLSSWLFYTMKPQWPQLKKVTVYETESAGSAYTGKETWESFKKFSFDSCFLEFKGERLGHTFKVRLHVKDQLQEPFGWTIDFGDIKKLFKPYLEQLDHHCLSHVEGLNSTTLQCIAQWIMEKVKPELPSLCQVYLENTPYCSVKLTIPE